MKRMTSEIITGKRTDSYLAGITKETMNCDVMGSWEDYADNRIVLLRSLDAFTNNKYEYVVAEVDGDMVIGTHGIIDLCDFLDTPAGLRYLDTIARNLGYPDFDDYVLLSENGLTVEFRDEAHGVIRKDDGSIDKVNSSAYIFSLENLAVLLVEHLFACVDGDYPLHMTSEEARTWILGLTGLRYDF